MKLDGGTAGPSNLEKPNGHAGAIYPSPPYRKGPPRKRPILNAEALAAIRDRLVAEIAGLGSVDVAVEWARVSIAAKNTPAAEDAGAVETAFRMQVLESGPEASAEDQVGPPSAASPIGSVVAQHYTLRTYNSRNSRFSRYWPYPRGPERRP